MGVSEDGPPKKQHGNRENDDTPWIWEPPFFRQTKKKTLYPHVKR